MHVCLYVCMYVCIVYMYVCMYVYMYSIDVCMYVCMSDHLSREEDLSETRFIPFPLILAVELIIFLIIFF